MRRKIRKAPTMPKWYWLLEIDGCWQCKNHNNCHNCSMIKKYRKEYFKKKIKGQHCGKEKRIKNKY